MNRDRRRRWVTLSGLMLCCWRRFSRWRGGAPAAETGNHGEESFTDVPTHPGESHGGWTWEDIIRPAALELLKYDAPTESSGISTLAFPELPDLGDDPMAAEHHMHADGPSKTMRAIEAGGRTLIMVCQRRIADALDALDAGDFVRVQSHLSNAASVIGPLSTAQTYIAIADGAQLIAARDLKAGMKLSDVGVIDSIEVKDCAAEKCGGHVIARIGDHEVAWDGRQELYVDAEES